MSRHETPGDIIASLTARHSQDGYVSHSELCRAYETVISRLCADLEVYRGTALTPQAGCALHQTSWGDATVWVELEIQPEEGDGWNEPHHDESVRVIGILVNGRMCDADLADEDTQERWVQEWLDERRIESEQWAIEQREAA